MFETDNGLEHLHVVLQHPFDTFPMTLKISSDANSVNTNNFEFFYFRLLSWNFAGDFTTHRPFPSLAFQNMLRMVSDLMFSYLFWDHQYQTHTCGWNKSNIGKDDLQTINKMNEAWKQHTSKNNPFWNEQLHVFRTGNGNLKKMKTNSIRNQIHLCQEDFTGTSHHSIAAKEL